MNHLSNHVQGMCSCQVSCDQEKYSKDRTLGFLRCATPRAGSVGQLSFGDVATFFLLRYISALTGKYLQ
jgi:hypothetical protein